MRNTDAFIVHGGKVIGGIPTPKQTSGNRRARAIEEDITHADALLSMPRDKFIDWRVTQEPKVEQFAELLSRLYHSPALVRAALIENGSPSEPPLTHVGGGFDICGESVKNKTAYLSYFTKQTTSFVKIYD